MVGSTEHSSGEATPAAVLGHLHHFGGLCLKVVESEDDQLAVLTFGNDTTRFETTSESGGQDHPALPIETVEELSKEHFFSFPSVRTADPPVGWYPPL